MTASALRQFKRGDPIDIVIDGAGVRSVASGKVLKVTKAGVWLDNGEGNDPSGPFDPISGRDLSDIFIPAWTRFIRPQKKQFPQPDTADTSK